MDDINAVRRLTVIIRRYYMGKISMQKAREDAWSLFQEDNGLVDEELFLVFFSVLVEYFVNPVGSASNTMRRFGLSRDDLLLCYKVLRESMLARAVFLSAQYPRSALITAASNMVSFMIKNSQYLPKIVRGEMVGPMMLEIHPTNATCIYRCKMCIWCGGRIHGVPISDLYNSECLLTADQWCAVLREARELGTEQVILSGGGETLLMQDKVKPVLDYANLLGFKTMIYTNGRTLNEINSALVESILDSTWLRVSLHAATPDVYARLVNRPLEANDFGHVLDGIRRIMQLKKERGSGLKIGIGTVLQPLNSAQAAMIANLCSDLELDFFDVRVDCISITEELSEGQREQMYRYLRAVRDDSESGLIRAGVSFADDLIISIDQWIGMKLPEPTRCYIPVLRPAIDPFGIVGACDSIGEPYTRSLSPREYILGRVGEGHGFKDIMHSIAGQQLKAHCRYCMPGQISLNVLMQKIIDDFKLGINPEDQPFCFEKA